MKNERRSLPSRKIAILGFGREGKSLLRFLRSRGLTRTRALRATADKHGQEKQTDTDTIWILDKNQEIQIPRGVKAQLGKNYLHNLEKFDIIFRSPGVPYNLPELIRARRHGAAFSSATKLFFSHLKTQHPNLVIIGITGTKGKGTTSTLLYKILKTAGGRVHLAGNIGTPVLDILPKLADRRGLAPVGGRRRTQTNQIFVILELSSFQLQDLEQSPHIAVVLDIFPDHQDSHLSLKEYYGAKANIARYQKRGDKIFYFANSFKSAAIAKKSPGKKIAVSETNWKLFGPEDLKIPGHHNFKNAVMAASVALSLGVPKRIILKTVKSFRGLPHRLELVHKIKLPNVPQIKSNDSQIAKKPTRSIRAKFERKNSRKIREIVFYNDSASTNPHTAAAAIRAFSRHGQMSAVNNGQVSLVLIAGGQDKGLNYRPLARALRGSNVKLAVLYGENKLKIARAIKHSGVKVKIVPNLKIAVETAYSSALSRNKFVNSKRNSLFADGRIVLFSPASASFDQFKNYADRGEKFKRTVRGLKQR